MQSMLVSEESLEEVRRTINELNLDPIKFKLMDEKEGEEWSREYVDEVEVWYKRFLFLNFKFRNRAIVVNRVLDIFWHYHILDTAKYAEDCERIFGYFFHHFPYFGMRGPDDARNLKKAFDETLELFRQEYGETLPSFTGAASCADPCTTPCDSPPSFDLERPTLAK